MMKQLLPFAAFLILAGCDVDQTQEGELPEVDVEVDAKEGKMPKFDVDWADVDVGTTTKTVKIPKVVVVMEEEEVEVPYIDVNMPNADPGDREERTIMVEAEVSDTEHSIEIRKILASGENLIVVSELQDEGTDLGDRSLRVSDQVTLNAPSLNVRHYIIGERPDRLFNGRYKYVSSMDELEDELEGYKEIYSR